MKHWTETGIVGKQTNKIAKNKTTATLKNMGTSKTKGCLDKS